MSNNSQNPAILPTGHYDSAAINRARNLLDVMPENVGPYRILERLGGGGMGEVYRAEQRSPIRRDVALKFIKLGMDTKQVLARFEAERQALALMDHQHIAKVFDAGTDDTGRPYFVMEYVKGKPITEYADQNHLSISERLELFEQVCQAVQHAHHKGIIHRDLKPGNVLVSTQDGRPFSKVIDFGIAKATAQRLTDHTLFTEHAQFIGTPQYMSPEQAEGSVDIDTRTDVYSLGVMLYELLTGTTPFSSQELKAAVFDQIKKLIIEVDPPKPSTRLSLNQPTLATLAASRRIEPKRLGTLVKGELDWIVMKALEKDRKRRYETPASLANDISCHLKGEPVQAAPPSTAYRIQKFVKKNWGAVIATAMVAGALLIGMAGTTWGYFRAERIASHERIAKTEATKARNSESLARKDALTAKGIAEQRARELEWQSYRNGIQAAHAAIEQGRLQAGKEILGGLPKSKRGWEWEYLHAESDSSLGAVPIPPNTLRVHPSADGAYALLVSRDAPNGPFALIRASDGSQTHSIHLPNDQHDVLGIAVAAQGERIAILASNSQPGTQERRSTLLVWDKLAARIVLRVDSSIKSSGYLFAAGSQLTISANGKRVALCALTSMKDGDFRLDFANRRFVIQTDDGKQVYAGPAIAGVEMSPGGDYLIGTHFINSIVDVRRENDAALQSLGTDINDHHLTDNATVVAVRTQTEWKLYDLAARSVIRPIHIPNELEKSSIYGDGSVAVGAIDGHLEYLGTGKDDARFRHGRLPNDITNILTDSSTQSVFVYSAKFIYRFPLLTQSQIDWLNRTMNIEAIAPNGESIVSNEGGSFILRETISQQPLQHLGYSGKLAYSRDGGRLFVIDHDTLKKASLFTFANGNWEQEVTSVPIAKLAALHYEKNLLFDSQTGRVAMSGSFREKDAKLDWAVCHVIDFVDQNRSFSIRDYAPNKNYLSTMQRGDGSVFEMTKWAAIEPVSLDIDRCRLLIAGKLKEFDSRDGAIRRETHVRADEACISWDGKRLAAADGDSVSIYSLPEYRLLVRRRVPIQHCEVIAWAANDTRLLLSCDRSLDGRFTAVVLETAALESVVAWRHTSDYFRGVTAFSRAGPLAVMHSKLFWTVPFSARWPAIRAVAAAECDLDLRTTSRETARRMLSEEFKDSDALRSAIYSSVDIPLLRKMAILKLLEEAEQRFSELQKAHGVYKDRMFAETQRASERGELPDFKLINWLISRWVPPTSKLNDAAWIIVASHVRSANEYQTALSFAQQAAAQEPDSASILNTLGVALYRTGDFQDAIDTLAKSESLRPHAANKIVTAMAKFRLGDKAVAAALIEHVKQQALMTKNLLDIDGIAFLKEAEVMLDPNPPIPAPPLPESI